MKNKCDCCGTVEGSDGSFAEKGATYALTFTVNQNGKVSTDTKTVHQLCGVNARLAFIKESGGQLPPSVSITVESWYQKNQEEANRGVNQLVAGSSVVKAAMDAARAAKGEKDKATMAKRAAEEAAKRVVVPPLTKPTEKTKPPKKIGKGKEAKKPSGAKSKAGSNKGVAAMIPKGSAPNTAMGAAFVAAGKGAK